MTTGVSSEVHTLIASRHKSSLIAISIFKVQPFHAGSTVPSTFFLNFFTLSGNKQVYSYNYLPNYFSHSFL